MTSTRRPPKHRNGRAAAAGLVAGVLALAMATGINLGILGAAGSPKGPGALEGTQVVAVGRPEPRDAGRSLGRLLHERRGERGRGPESTEPTETAAVTTSAPPSPNGVAPSPTPYAAPSWSPAPPQPQPATARWNPPAGGSDSQTGGSEAEHSHHRFGANNDD